MGRPRRLQRVLSAWSRAAAANRRRRRQRDLATRRIMYCHDSVRRQAWWGRWRAQVAIRRWARDAAKRRGRRGCFDTFMALRLHSVREGLLREAGRVRQREWAVRCFHVWAQRSHVSSEARRLATECQGRGESRLLRGAMRSWRNLAARRREAEPPHATMLKQMVMAR
jgi:hypothetical protein